MGRKRIPRDERLTVYRIVFDKADPLEEECARYLLRAEPRHLVPRLKKLVMLGYEQHRETVRQRREQELKAAKGAVAIDLSKEREQQ